MGSASIGDPQSLNLFAYVTNNPVDFVDPSGLNLAAPFTGSPACYLDGIEIPCRTAANLVANGTAEFWTGTVTVDAWVGGEYAGGVKYLYDYHNFLSLANEPIDEPFEEDDCFETTGTAVADSIGGSGTGLQRANYEASRKRAGPSRGTSKSARRRDRKSKIKAKQAAKSRIVVGKSIARKTAVIGVAIGAADIANSYSKEGRFGSETQVIAAGVAGGLGGAAIGSSIGAAAGAPFAGIGAIPGAVIGGFVGGIVGGYLGSEGSKSVVRQFQRRRCK